MKVLIKHLQISLMVISLSILVAPLVQAQNKYNKLITKGEAFYEKGSYKKALKRSQKLKKISTRKLGADNKFTAIALLKEAKYKEARGFYADFDTLIAQGINMSKKSNGETHIEHALILIDAADILINYGNFRLAGEYATTAKKIYDSDSSSFDEVYKAKLELVIAESLAGQGYYNEALATIDQHMNFFLGRTAKKVSFIDPKTGKLKSERLSGSEREQRYKDFANIITLKAYTFRKKGSFISADSAFNYSGEWIKDKLGKGSFEHINNTYQTAQFLEENGLKDIPTEMYKDAMKKAKNAFKPTHVLYVDIYESILRSYLINGENRLYRKERKDFEKYLKKRFHRNSFHREKDDLLSFDRSFASERVGRIEKKAQEYLNNPKLLPQNHPRRELLIEFLYNVALADKKYANGEIYLNEILVIKKINTGDNSPEFHLTKTKLANHYLAYTNKLNVAGEIYKDSFYGIVFKQMGSRHMDLVPILNNIAEYYEVTDDYKKASQTLEEAKEFTRIRYSNTDMAYAAELSKIASLQIKIGEYTNASANIDIAKEILRREKDEEADVYKASTLETEAQLLAIKGLLDDAEDNLSEANKIIRKSNSTIVYNELAAAEEMADLNVILGRYGRSQTAVKAAIEEYTQYYGEDSRKLLRPNATSARLMLISGEYTDAEKLIRRNYNNAVSIYGDQSTKVVPSLILLSDLNSTLGDYEKAEENIEKAIAIQERQFGKKHVDVASSKVQLALIKFYQNENLKEIENLILNSKEIIADQLGSLTPKYAEVITDLAKVYIAAGRYDEAFDRLKEAQKIWEKKAGKRNNIKVATIHILTGDIYYIQRKYKQAETSYTTAKNLYERFFSNKHPEYVKVVSKLARVHYMDGDTRKSAVYLEEALTNYNGFIKEYFPALSEREKAKFWNTIRGDFEFYNTIAVTLYKEKPEMLGKMYNNALNTKALLLSSSIKMRERILSSTDQDLKAKYAEWVGKKEQLTNVLSMSQQQLVENGINPSALAQEVEFLEKDLSQKSELFAQGFETNAMEWTRVKKILKPNEVALEMIRFRHFNHTLTDSVQYAILFVKNDAAIQPELILLNNGKDLEGKYLKSFRNNIKFRLDDKVSYNQFWAPIKDRIGITSSIYISPDGVYNQINLEAIPTPDDKYVIDNANIILVSNTKDIYFKRVKTQLVQEQKEAVIFGNPIFYASASDGSGKIGQLPGTETEVIELKKLFVQNGWMADDFVETRATEESLKKLDNPKIFHIATHGFFSSEEDMASASVNTIELSESAAVQNPLLRTGLLLSGAGDLLDKTNHNYNQESGILTAYEAMNLNLDLTDLVVLSACETGLGDVTAGEGVYGLQRAFMVAGAKTLVMSLFKVSDEATQKLMVTFYKKWLETGNKRQSFVDAKKELRNLYNDPIYWGAFVMLGMD